MPVKLGVVLLNMKAKVLYTNGQRTLELFWVTHTDTDVYCGTCGSNRKRSYHASGKIHTKENDKEKDGAWVAPLKQVKGQFHLSTIGITNSRQWADAAFKRIEFKHHKVDAALYVDSRTIPENEFINVGVGLLEPNNFRSLEKLIKAIGNVKQVLLSTNSTPWVYCILIWPVDTAPNKSLERDRAKLRRS